MNPSKPLLMGILNVTPDSFSDGGLHFQTRSAIEAGLRMAEDGADILDIGGESTRPGAEPVSADEEMRRVLAVVAALASNGLKVSIDTCKAEVAKAALDAGATIVNDVTALSDPLMASVCANAGCTVCLMHMQGEPRTMQLNPSYDDVVGEVLAFLLERAEWAQQQGVAREKIWIDPGIGFGKTLAHNVTLLKHLHRFVDTGYPVLLGASRKSFIGKILGGLPTEERLEGTLAAQVLAQSQGVRIIRAHDVKSARRAIDVTAAILDA